MATSEVLLGGGDALPRGNPAVAVAEHHDQERPAAPDFGHSARGRGMPNAAGAALLSPAAASIGMGRDVAEQMQGMGCEPGQPTHPQGNVTGVFTLNHDLLVEIAYLPRFIWLKWAAAEVPGMQASYEQGRPILDDPTKLTWQRTVKTRVQPYFKLHGSSTWKHETGVLRIITFEPAARSFGKLTPLSPGVGAAKPNLPILAPELAFPRHLRRSRSSERPGARARARTGEKRSGAGCTLEARPRGRVDRFFAAPSAVPPSMVRYLRYRGRLGMRNEVVQEVVRFAI